MGSIEELFKGTGRVYLGLWNLCPFLCLICLELNRFWAFKKPTLDAILIRASFCNSLLMIVSMRHGILAGHHYSWLVCIHIDRRSVRLIHVLVAIRDR